MKLFSNLWDFLSLKRYRQRKSKVETDKLREVSMIPYDEMPQKACER